MPPAALFDAARFMEVQQLLGARLVQLASKFQLDAEQQLIGMRSAALECSAEKLKHCAHKLKGASAGLAAYALAEHCAALERKAIHRQLDDLMPLIDTIADCYAQTRAALDSYLSNQPFNSASERRA